MGANRGTNRAGVTGIFSITPGQQYGGDVYAWSRTHEIPERKIMIRGGPRWGVFRRLDAGSVISFRINGGGTAWPGPINVESSGGTLVLQYDGNKRVTLAGEVIGLKESFDAGEKVGSQGGENWDIGVTLRLTAAPTYAGWPGTQTTATPQTFLDRQDAAGLSKRVDPNYIGNAARAQWDVGTISATDLAEKNKMLHFLGSSVALSGLVNHTASLRRTDSGGVVISVEQRTRSTIQDVTMPGTHSEGSGWEFTDAFTTVINSTNSDAVERNLQFAIYQSVQYFAHLTVTSINPNQKRLTVYYRNIGTLVEFVSGDPAGRWLPAVLNSGNFQVCVHVQMISAQLFYVTHRSLDYKTRIRRRFTLTAFVSFNTTVPDHAALSGMVNNATFLGLAAGTVMFLRTRGKANLGLANPIPSFLTYEFETDDAGFFDYQGVKDDTFISTASLTSNRGYGMVNASLFATEKSIVITAPTQTDFSVFIP